VLTPTLVTQQHAVAVEFDLRNPAVGVRGVLDGVESGTQGGCTLRCPLGETAPAAAAISVTQTTPDLNLAVLRRISDHSWASVATSRGFMVYSGSSSSSAILRTLRSWG
jgi:hypothetical protein